MQWSDSSLSIYLSTPDDGQKTRLSESAGVDVISSKYRSKMWGMVWTTLARLYCQHCDSDKKDITFWIPMERLIIL